MLPKRNEEGFYFFSTETDPRLFFCSETGQPGIDIGFVDMLDQLRYRCGFPFVITSGFRAKTHSVEAKKAKPGYHAQGIAADIRVRDGVERRTIVEKAIEMRFGGIGVADDFVHVDTRPGTPVMWTY